MTEGATPQSGEGWKTRWFKEKYILFHTRQIEDSAVSCVAGEGSSVQREAHAPLERFEGLLSSPWVMLYSVDNLSASSSSGTPLGFQVRRWPGWAAEDVEDGGDPISPRPLSDELNGRNEENGVEDLKIVESVTRSWNRSSMQEPRRSPRYSTRGWASERRRQGLRGQKRQAEAAAAG